MWCHRRSRLQQIINRLDHLHDDIIELHRQQQINLGVDMGQNEDLAEIVANQNEADTELAGLPARVVELLEQVKEGEPVDPAILAEALEGSRRLAGVVPGKPAAQTPDPVEPSPENPAPVEPAPVETLETPTPQPVDPAAEPEAPLEQETPPVVEEAPSPVTTQAAELLDAASSPDATVNATDDGTRFPG